MRNHALVSVFIVSLLFAGHRSLFTSHWPSAEAQMTNGAVTLAQEGIASAGGRLGGGNSMSVVTALGDAVGGLTADGALAIRAGYPALRHAPIVNTKLIRVEGTVDEPVASVVVNRIAAVITGSAFRAEGVLLRDGLNTITVTATDLAGNIATKTITVTLDLQPPARPTVAATPATATGSRQALSGTKMPGTSLWINGTEVMPLSAATSWTVSMPLIEGDNTFIIVAKDAAGNASTTNTVNVLVDNLPPVVTFAPPAKTNLSPVTLQGTVDDCLTTVTINGLSAARSGNTFSTSMTLAPGPNSFHLVAVSPNGHRTERDDAIALGTIPTIQSVQPADAAKLYAGAAATIRIIASDAQSDPIEYRMLLDGSPLGAWGPASSQSWIPGIMGLHTLTLAVRDAFGGSNQREVEVCVVRAPIEHP